MTQHVIIATQRLEDGVHVEYLGPASEADCFAHMKSVSQSESTAAAMRIIELRPLPQKEAREGYGAIQRTRGD